MAYHHVAVAVSDLAETHRFYTEVMGFELVKAQAAPTDAPGGWAKHVFYATGPVEDGQSPELIAFWELHDERMTTFDTAISTGLGLEPWVNHIAFHATDRADIDARRQRWLDHGADVVEIDHGFCLSIYTLDPNRILVEFCTDLAPYTAEDRAHALALIHDPDPTLEAPPAPTFHLAPKADAPVAVS
jgi:catechol 2,3-dioxygenase-like lactoylglutathione lyase family enzyme